MLWVVSGTGTGVGKTSVACALAWLMGQRGPTVGWKPVETGAEGLLGPDQLALGNESTFHVKQCPKSQTFRLPASPHFAAHSEGTAVDVAAIVAEASRLRTQCTLVLELAGGLFTPLTDRLLNIDAVVALSPDRHILVAPDRLGVLHDAIACVTAAQARACAPDRLLLNQISDRGEPLANRTELPRYVTVPVGGPIPYERDVRARAGALASILDGIL